jgi:hypothetical protein
MVRSMNERIRELAVQAGLNAPYGSDHEGLRDFDYRKFAELIVRECAGVGYEASYSECALNVSNKILEHFGVQE